MDQTRVTLADKAAIADLVHTYALNIRNRQPERNEALFTADAVFEVREADPMQPDTMMVRSRSQGLAAVMQSVCASTARNRVFPAIHNLIVTLNGDQAEASSLMIATVFPGGHEMLGEYDDRFRREQQGWRFAARTYTIYREAQI